MQLKCDKKSVNIGSEYIWNSSKLDHFNFVL